MTRTDTKLLSSHSSFIMFLVPLTNLELPGVQDAFISRVSRSKETIARKAAKKKRGWYTVERMRSSLGWSKSLE